MMNIINEILKNVVLLEQSESFKAFDMGLADTIKLMKEWIQIDSAENYGGLPPMPLNPYKLEVQDSLYRGYLGGCFFAQAMEIERRYKQAMKSRGH